MDILSSWTALVVAVAALLGGAANVLRAIAEFRKGKPMNRGKVKKLSTLAAVFLVFGAALTTAWSLGRWAEASEQERIAAARPLNEQLTSEAWEAYNKDEYEAAILKARECIDEFEGGANRQQVELETAKAPHPPKDRFTETEKKEVLARGLLNDVATSYFIVGRSAERLGRSEDAKEAYRHATRYSYARTWDPKGWFWSPAEAAEDRLARLQ
jgi:hypothetical protein